MENEKNFVVYDYMTKEVKKEKEAMVRDCYESFGWELVSKETTYFSTAVLNFRRDRKAKNNPEISTLQRKMEKLLEETNNYEKQKTSGGYTLALIIGVIGALILGGGMSIVMVLGTGNLALFIVGIILGIIGLAVCGFNLLILRNVNRKKTAKMSSLIEEKYDELSATLTDAHAKLKTE